jgi:BASS family bile acid:Na+ symporter
MTTAAIVLLAVKASIAGLVFALGLRSRPEDILSLVERPGLLARSFVAMNLVVPLFAIAAVKLLALRVDLAVTLIALSLSPVPPLLPRKVSKAGGDRSFVVGLLVVFAVLSIAWIPLGVYGVGSIFGRQLDVSPSAIAWIVATLILAPLLLGLALRRYAGDFARRIEPAVALVAGAVLALVAVLIVASTASAMREQIGDGTIALLAAFVVVGLAAGHLLGGPDPHERTDLALAAASRHPGIALATAQMIAPDAPAVTALVAIYLIVNVVIGLPYVRWRVRRTAARTAQA